MEKFNRSSEQFDQLRAEMETFFSEPDLRTTEGEFDRDAWEWVERVRLKRSPPLRFGVLLGDVLHNLRSALDHMIWQVVLLDGGTPGRQTQYPIVTSNRRDFEAERRRRVPDLSAIHADALDKTQPYHRGDKARTHPLAVLRDLSNVDKHQIVHATYSVLAEQEREPLKQHEGDAGYVWQIYTAVAGTPIEDGTPIVRIQIERGQEPPKSVKVGGNFALEVAFGDIGLSAHSIPDIANDVLKIIQAFMRDFPETEFTN